MKIKHGYDRPRRVRTTRAWIFCCWWFTGRPDAPTDIELFLRLCGCWIAFRWRAK